MGLLLYLLPHIGNYRTFLYEDVSYRYLDYLGYKVERALNITDVEDKAIAEAEKEGVTLKKLTERNAKIFLQELKLLKAETPTFIPRSSTRFRGWWLSKKRANSALKTPGKQLHT